jgi:hypothetical protein
MNNEKAIHWIDQALQTLRDTQKEQSSLDQQYDQFVKCLKQEMNNLLPKRTQKFNSFPGGQRKNRQSKPWWDNILTNLWQLQRRAEHKWKHSSPGNKPMHKQDFVSQRKKFDREYQQKRRLWIKSEWEKLTAALKEISGLR